MRGCTRLSVNIERTAGSVQQDAEVAMTMRKVAPNITVQALLKVALGYPETEEGVACKGTVLESTTVMIRKKAFVFVRSSEARFKLRESQKEMAALATKDPGHYGTGANGWASIKFTDDTAAPLELLEKWVGESYRVVGGKEPTAALVNKGARVKKKSKRVGK